jgi:RHS repeat-associated protein
MVGATINGVSALFVVNGLGQRVYKNGTAYAYDEAGRLVGEYSGGQGQETVYLGDTPVAVLQGGQAYYVYADHLNTPRVITDSANKVVWRWDSDPFGSDAANEDPDGDGVRFAYNLRFPGQYFDQETGLHYNYFRDYDPGTGRYVESDPIALGGGINTYLYSNANPVMRTDARGLFDSVHHNEATAKGADAAGFGSDVQSWLIPQVSGVDFLPHSQDPSNSDWHAMRDPSWTVEQAEARWSKIVNGVGCDWDKLPLALHAAQDSCARGHKGFQPWDGHITTEHLSGDVKPTPEEMRCAINITQKILEEFKKRCTCMK